MVSTGWVTTLTMADPVFFARAASAVANAPLRLASSSACIAGNSPMRIASISTLSARIGPNLVSIKKFAM